MRSRFPNEFIGIVPWSNDIKKYIVNSLTPLKERFVEAVEIDEENLVANVKVSTDEAYKVALEAGHNNVKVASELTGWILNIQGPKRTGTMPAPDEELREKLMKHIPEIKNNEIEIVKIARIKGRGSRVIVRWKNGKDTERLMASEVCNGSQHERLRAIKDETVGEWIYFHEWFEDLEKLIISCLYPLRESDVDSIDFDYESKTAIVNLKNIRQSPPLWRDQYNLALSEIVTDWKIEIRERA